MLYHSRKVHENKRGEVECMFDIERSLELSIGTRFHFWDSIYEVAELEEGEEWGCSRCALAGEENICEVMNCNHYRQDKKRIFFKEVKATKEKTNE